MSKLELPERILVGSYFLETLTTGMYENPLHCVREYVQNAFDAILDARRNGILNPDKGSISVRVEKTSGGRSLIIEDDGCGISAAEAVITLLSLGNSAKSPTHHAGFRGIGRLAGIAYCQTLRFVTSAAGEKVSTLVEFDCALLRTAMRPGTRARDISDVIKEATSVSSSVVSAADHFTRVELLVLTEAGSELVEEPNLTDYLRQHSPVGYSDDFSSAKIIEAAALQYGVEVPKVTLTLSLDRKVVPIYKPYRDVFGGGPEGGTTKLSKIRKIETFGDASGSWFGWFADTNFPGEVQDDAISGFRFRMKNIQIDGVGIAERILGDTSAKTDRRFTRWMVGEIFIGDTLIVPNARRDGFEDGKEWRSVQESLKDLFAGFAKHIRIVSARRNSLSKVETNLKDVGAKVAQLGAKATREEKKKVDDELAKQLKTLERNLKKGADEKRVSALVSQIKELRERTEAIPETYGANKLNLSQALTVISTTLRDHLPEKEVNLIETDLVPKLRALAS